MNKKSILCFGDSNTWGFIPGAFDPDTFYPSEKWNDKDTIPYKKTRDRGICTEMTFSFTPEEQNVVDLTKESNLTETNEVISESKNAERVGPAVSV